MDVARDINVLNQPNIKVFEEISFILSSERRLEILCAILKDANNARSLKQKLKVSKSYLNRCLAQLENKSLITKNNRGICITDFGQSTAFCSN